MVAEPRRDLPVPLRVDLRRPDGSTTVEYAVNISPGGLCLQLKDPLAEGDQVQVEFTLPPSGLTVRAEARVVWTNWMGAEGDEEYFCETGLQLAGLDETLRQQLHDYAIQPPNRRR
jgi:uncharacterized protein (TIGR02266 family)